MDMFARRPQRANIGKRLGSRGKESAFIFFVNYGHSELELAPALTGVSISKLSDALPVIARVKEVVKTG
jgi:hypothetical protein